ncbi:Protein DBF4 B [Liparis tanakae]|uniref:Protein DBF4 B n=1 Tax=Liparis tanakae TaxID=230148 RepID=A0A4Z2G2C0_9TELE|nr:Protein DBF4 B [Liparis tanakae]
MLFSFLILKRVESFLHKDVSFVVTGSQEGLKEQKCTETNAERKGTSEEAQRPIMQRESILSSDKRRPGTPRPTACGSRGKALLEKAIRNNERLQGNSVLTNARSWGVKILYVDDVLLYMKQLNRESFSAVHKRPERASTKQHACHVVKAAPLRSPFLKIEDMSRRYKPLHMQSMICPTLWYSGRFSPFESPPPRFEEPAEPGEKKTREKKKVESSILDKSQATLGCNRSLSKPRKKEVSYCECCHQPFTNLDEHMQSDQHRAFVLDASNYSEVDQLMTEMLPGFDPNPAQQSDETLSRTFAPSPRPPTPLSTCDLEPLTDAEVERAVRDLHRHGSSFHLCGPAGGPRSSGPSSPSPGDPFPIPNSPDTRPPDIQRFSINTDCQLTDSHRHASSPTMPVLDIEPQAHNSARWPPDVRHSSPSSDPYSLPPVLSPQVPYTCVTEPRCPYSEPPVLSPQQYTAEEAHTWDSDAAVGVSQDVPDPISTAQFPSVASANADGVNQSAPECILGLSELIRSTNGLELVTPSHRRSRSLPRQMATTPNPRKRCRSASPEHGRSKRRRITAEFGYRGSWTKQVHTSAKPPWDIRAKPEGWSLSDKVSCPIIRSSPLTKDSSTFGPEQTFTMFCVPTVHNSTQATNQIILGQGGTSLAHHPSWPLSSSPCGPPLPLPSDIIHSRDSRCALSRSPAAVCIESALIPDVATLSPSSSDSDWDCGLLSRLGPSRAAAAAAAPPPAPEQSRELDRRLLRTPCAWTHGSGYESRLRTALRPSPPATSLCGDEADPSAFSRTVVQIVEVQH